MSKSNGPGAAHLPVSAQLFFTDGYNDLFAQALQRLRPGEFSLRRLVVNDPGYAEKVGMAGQSGIKAHVFALDRSNYCVDAEGRRPILEMLRSFGIRRGMAYQILIEPPRAPIAPHARHSAACDLALQIMTRAGWAEHDIPMADSRLARSIKAERQALAASRPSSVAMSL